MKGIEFGDEEDLVGGTSWRFHFRVGPERREQRSISVGGEYFFRTAQLRLGVGVDVDEMVVVGVVFSSTVRS